MDIRPETANLETETGNIEEVDPDDVPVGSVIIVRPGEKIPIDGVVIEGQAALNTSALTGESLPRDVGEGDAVISGCISMDGVLRIRTEREFNDSTVSRILELVENASSRKSRSEKFISKFARVYTPAVCGAALALAVLPPLCGLGEWHEWLYRALTFLVISCPCALIISIPLTFFAGIGGASREGILVKGSNYLEALAEVKTIALDKTGTLTRGLFEVTEIIENRIEKEKLLDLAAHAEGASTHPIAKSIVAAYRAPLDLSRVSDVREIGGLGVTCKVDGTEVAVGRRSLTDGASDLRMRRFVYCEIVVQYSDINLEFEEDN
jgi:Cd2+/Zn2+-exporting ATPase